MTTSCHIDGEGKREGGGGRREREREEQIVVVQVGKRCRGRGSPSGALLIRQSAGLLVELLSSGWISRGWWDVLLFCITGQGHALAANRVEYPCQYTGVVDTARKTQRKHHERRAGPALCEYVGWGGCRRASVHRLSLRADENYSHTPARSSTAICSQSKR